jgi:hypothetical protein
MHRLALVVLDSTVCLFELIDNGSVGVSLVRDVVLTVLNFDWHIFAVFTAPDIFFNAIAIVANEKL